MSIIKTRKIWITISSILVICSIIATAVWKLNLGIDFTGGSLMEIEYTDERPSKSVLEEKLASINSSANINIQEIGDKSYILRMKTLSEDEHHAIASALKEVKEFDEKRFESVGPVIGQELQKKAIWSIILVLIAIIIYIAWAFRKVSRPVASWKYGLIGVIALFHDIMITIGVFAVLGKFLNVEVGLPFVAALLTILGYSINDTIVVFDRIRENLTTAGKAEDFSQIVDKSINQTIARSVNTSLTTILALVAIYFFGGETLKYFALALIIGIFFGTYSSIFLASPMLVISEKLRMKK